MGNPNLLPTVRFMMSSMDLDSLVSCFVSRFEVCKLHHCSIIKPCLVWFWSLSLTNQMPRVGQQLHSICSWILGSQTVASRCTPSQGVLILKLGLAGVVKLSSLLFCIILARKFKSNHRLAPIHPLHPILAGAPSVGETLSVTTDTRTSEEVSSVVCGMHPIGPEFSPELH